MYRLSRLTGLITTLSLLMLLLTSCRDYQAEERIRADAAIAISSNQANATMSAAQARAEADKVMAQSKAQADTTIAQTQAEADKYKAEQATKQASIWAEKLPLVATIATFAILAAIVLIYRGKIGLKRVDKEVLLLSPPSPPPSPMPSMTLTPMAVIVEAQRRSARVAPGDAPGVWLLTQPDGRQLVMRPKQLIDSMRS